MTMAPGMVVRPRGGVRRPGPPLAIYNEPANYFVAGFFGIPAMNFIDGELHQALGRLRLPGARTEARPDPLRAERGRAGDAGRAARARSALPPRRGLASRGEAHRALG